MTSRRLDIKGILRNPLYGPILQARALAGILSRRTYTPHTLPMDYETRHKSFELMAKYGGGFCQKLAAAWFVADTRNKQRIEQAFPDYMAEYGPSGDFWVSDHHKALVSRVLTSAAEGKTDWFTPEHWALLKEVAPGYPQPPAPAPAGE